MAVDGVLMRSSELLSSLQVEIRSLLGLDQTGLILLSSAALGLLITLVLWVCLRRGSSETHPGKSAPDPGSTVRPRAEESKRRSRRRGGGGGGGGGGEKKLQRNGLVDLEEELKPVEAQNQDQNQNPNESPDTAGGKSDKAKKNKKKAKAAAKEPKTTASPSARKEQEEVGSWETKVSNREKRQQKKKDKGPGEDSPGGAEPAANANNTTTEPAPAPALEEPKITVAPTPSTAKPSKTNKASKNANVPTPAAPKKEEAPAVDVTTAVIPPAVSQVWEDVLSRSIRPDPFVGVSVPAEMPGVPSQPWNSVTLPPERQKPEPSVWPQDMEGSWTIVDSSHIPVSFHGLSAGVEPQFACDLSWACQPPVDDEWSGLNSASADPVSDWSAPCEEWGNYEELAGVAPHPEEPQESEPEKDRDEAAAPGSGKAKKKKKKKKKVDDAGTAAPVDVEVNVSKVQNSAGITVPKTAKEQDRAAPSAPPSAPPRAVPKPAEPEAPPKPAAPPTQKKAEESWESPKQVKKKKARRET